jgi:hypothetical protein
MCSPATRDLIKQVVAGKIKRGEPFSAWEVTCELRKEFGITRQQERHDDIKRVVHASFANSEMGAYQRTPVTFQGNEAYVYHPTDVDPQTRQKISGGTTAVAVADDDDDDDTSVPSGNAIVSGTQTPATTVTKSINYGADTIYIPGAQVKALGLDQGDPAYVRVDGNRIRVSDDVNTGGKEIHVDINGNLRVHTSYLGHAGISGRSLSIAFVSDAVTGDEIVISEN